MENVPQVHGKKNLADWNAWLRFLDSLGYTNSYSDLNAMDYGVPQSRIRCFMVSTRDGSHYQFPKGWKLDRCLKDVLEAFVDESFYLSEKSIEGYKRRKADHVSRGVNFGWDPTEGEGVARCINTVPQKDCQNFIKVTGDLNKKGWLDKSNRVYDPDGVAPSCCAHASDAIAKVEVARKLAHSNFERECNVYDTNCSSPTVLTGCGAGYTPKIEDSKIMIKNPVTGKEYPGKDGYAMRLSNPGGEGPITNPEVAFTVKASVKDGVFSKKDSDLRIRYLTPRECWRLMGFSDEAYDKAVEIGTSKTQLYKQAGNSIVVDVLMAIFRPLYVEKKKGQPTLDAWF